MRAYYQEKRQRTRTGEDERLLVQRTLVVPVDGLSLPQENCTVVAVGALAAAADDSDAWSDAEAAAAEVAAGGPSGEWSGGAPFAGWASEQAVTFRLDGAPEDETGVVRHVERRVLASAGSAQTTRLTLEDV